MMRSNQHGFNKSKSCFTNLIFFYNEKTTWMDNETAVDIVCLDFGKAFDAVSQRSLIGKLN